MKTIYPEYKNVALEVNRTVGCQVKKYRKKLELTQSELAMRLEISTATVHRIEIGTKSLKVFDLPFLSYCLEITIRDLLGLKTDLEYFKAEIYK